MPKKLLTYLIANAGAFQEAPLAAVAHCQGNRGENPINECKFDYVKMSKFLIRICQRFQRRSPIKMAELQHGPQRAGVEHGGLKAPARDRGTKRGQTDRQTRQTPTQPSKKKTNPNKENKDVRGSLAHGVFTP